jgi:hypothetical protein
MRTRPILLSALALVLAPLNVLTPSAGAAPSNDNRSGAIAVTTPFSGDQSTTGATLEPGEPSCAGSGATVWYKFTLAGRGIVEASVVTGVSNPDGSVSGDYSPAIALYIGNDPSSLTRLGCQWSAGNAISIGGIQQPPGTYWVQIGGAGGTSGHLHIDITGQVTDPISTSGAVIPSTDCNQNVLDRNDDGSTGFVNLPFPVDFYGSQYNGLYVNNNGNVTFDGPLSTYTPFGLVGTQAVIIAPFFADIDTRGAGSNVVRYGYGNTVYEGHPAFCVDWVDVGYYSAHYDKLNSIQLLLVSRTDRGPGDFDIVFNYDRVEWETGDASGGSGGFGGSTARAGFSNGTGFLDSSFELAGSGVQGALLDSNSSTGLVHNRLNSIQNGRYVFSVTSGAPSCAADFDCDGLSDATERSQGTNPRSKDTDGDGLLDPWEVAPTVAGAGIRLPNGVVVNRDDVFGPYGPSNPDDCTQGIDGELRYSGPYRCLNHPPNPLRKDVYLEVDWQDCTLGSCPEVVSVDVDELHHAPSPRGLRDAVDGFRRAPVVNTYGATGINLNVTVDERIPHTPNCMQADAGSNLNRSSFGSVTQRSLGANVLRAKAMAVRYVWSGHSSAHQTVGGNNPCPNPDGFYGSDFVKQGLGLADLASYDWSPFGSVNVGGDFLVVTLGPTWSCPSAVGPTNSLPTSSTDLGPCYRETEANVIAFNLNVLDPGIYPAHIDTPEESHKSIRNPINRMLGERELDGTRQLWSRSLTHLLGHALGLGDHDAVHNDPAPAGRTQSGHTSPLAPLAPDDYGTYAGLRYAPSGPGGPVVAEHPPNYDELGFSDPDEDGVAEHFDNCPGVWNPDQSNDDNGFLHLGDNTKEFGDACDPDIDGDGKRNPLPGDGEVFVQGSPLRTALLAPGASTTAGNSSEDPVPPGYDPFPHDTDDDGQDNAVDTDDDGDGVADTVDNCRIVPNAGQADVDGDLDGDLCDVDADADGHHNNIEVLVHSDPLDAASRPEYAGLGTCSNGQDDDRDGAVDGADSGCADADGDSIADGDDTCPALATRNNIDRDGDGVGNACDLDVAVVDVAPQYLGASASTYKLAFTATENAAFSVRLGGTDCATGQVLTTGSYTAPAPRILTLTAATLAQGVNTLRVCATAGGKTVDVTTAVTRHTTAPSVSTPALAAGSDTGSSASDDLTNADLPALTGTATPGATVTVTQDGAFAGYVTADADGAWQVTDVGPVDEGAHAYIATASDGFGNATSSASRIVTVDRTAPVTTVTGGPAEGTDVSGAATFTFRVTEPGTTQCRVDGGAWAACTSPVTGPSSTGSHELALRSTDVAGNAEAAGPVRTWRVLAGGGFTFGGFYAPVDNLPTVNTAKAGSAIPVKFSLGRDQGIGVLAAGSPSSVRTDCATNVPLDEVEQTAAPGSSGLSYDAATGRYVYVWKTATSWAGQCRELRVTLTDGTVHRAAFKLR